MNRIFQILAAALVAASTAVPAHAGIVKGKVTAEGKPVAGVQVSDGKSIVTTDKRGNYRLVSDKADSVVFITTPSGYYAKPIDAIRPGFWQLLTEPAGKSETHDFTLVPQDQNGYSVMFVTDCHFANDPSRNDLERFKENILPIAKAEYEKAAERGPVYTFNLGDFTHDLYWFDYGLNEAAGEKYFADLGWPTLVYTCTGNHDNDASIAGLGEKSDLVTGWNYRRTWGPDRYAVNIGKDHWIVMDDVVYLNNPLAPGKHKNINGDRKYRCRFTQSQLEWLKKDLESVSADTRVFLCCHVPILNEPLLSERIEQTQLDTLDAIFSKFPKVYTYSGHTHQMEFAAGEGSKYTRFEPYILPATSGNMWTNPKGTQNVGVDGSDYGMFTMDMSAEHPVPYYITADYGHKLMRAYDLNSVAAYWASSEKCQRFHSAAPLRTWYPDEKYRNCVLLNYWGYRPGDVIEAYEYGTSLPVEKVRIDDPMVQLEYSVTKVTSKGTIVEKELKVRHQAHFFMVKCNTSDAPIVIRILSADGTEVLHEAVVRPKPFTITAEK